MSEEPQADVPQEQPSQSPAPAATPRKGCGGLFTWIVILAVGLIVIVLFVYRAQVEQQRKAEQERAMRHQIRQTQLSQVGDEVAKAAELIRSGDVSRGLDLLQAQSNLLTTVAQEAQSSGDSSDATDIAQKKSAISGAVSAIKLKQNEFQTFAEQQVSDLGSYFPQVNQAPPAAQGPAQTAGTKPPAAGSGQTPAAKGGQQTAPSAPPAAAPSAPPAPSAAPPAGAGQVPATPPGP